MNKIVGSRNSVVATIKEITQRPGKAEPYLMWVFSATGVERAVGFTDAEIIPGNRTWTWLEMLGFSLTPGMEFNLDLLKGFECIIFQDDSGTVRMVRRIQQPEACAPKGEERASRNTSASPTPNIEAETTPKIDPPKEDTQSEAERLFS